MMHLKKQTTLNYKLLFFVKQFKNYKNVFNLMQVFLHCIK